MSDPDQKRTASENVPRRSGEKEEHLREGERPPRLPVTPQRRVAPAQQPAPAPPTKKV